LGRRKLFDINLRNIKLADNIDWDLLVKKSDGFSGADVTNVEKYFFFKFQKSIILLKGL